MPAYSRKIKEQEMSRFEVISHSLLPLSGSVTLNFNLLFKESTLTAKEMFASLVGILKVQTYLGT